MASKNTRFLLDTHILLWWLTSDKRFKPQVKEIITDPKNLIITSVASLWEIDIKLKSKPNFKLKTSFNSLIKQIPFQIIPVTLEQVQKLHTLPYHHKDPFDRILIAQAKVENLCLITADEKMSRYRTKILRA